MFLEGGALGTAGGDGGSPVAGQGQDGTDAADSSTPYMGGGGGGGTGRGRVRRGVGGLGATRGAGGVGRGVGTVAGSSSMGDQNSVSSSQSSTSHPLVLHRLRAHAEPTTSEARRRSERGRRQVIVGLRDRR